MTKRCQFLIVVDIDADVVEDELTALMPHERDRREVLRLSERGAPRLDRHLAQPVDWLRLARAVERVATEVRALAQTAVALEVFVGGFAPLAVFAHLGYALSKFAGIQTFLHRDFGSGPWQAYPLAASEGSDEASIFAAPTLPAEASVTTGHVALYIDLNGRAVPTDAIRRLHDQTGLPLGAIVPLRSESRVVLAPGNAPQAARDLVQEFGRIPSFFPDAAGLTLLLAVAAPVAFMAGRSLNPTIAARVTLTNYHTGSYDAVLTLPFGDDCEPPIGTTEDDVKGRAAVQQRLQASLVTLQRALVAEDLPDTLDSELRSRLVARLRALTAAEGLAREFGLSISERIVAFGAGLLEAMRDDDTDRPGRFAQLLVLHEVLHTEQGVLSTNFHDVGRAGVVLEHVDFAADVFALETVTRLALRESPDAPAREVVVPWFEAMLYGIELFDRRQHPLRIEELPERRLRRYLTWHLQLQRARTVTSRFDVSALLRNVIAVELAPLAGVLSPRHDKVVRGPLSETEFFCAVDGRLVRRHAQGVLDPRTLVEAVRTYNHEVLRVAMHAVVEERRALLAPWCP